MRRRAFIAGLVCAAAISRAEAQQAGKVYRIAIAHPSYPASEMNEASGRLPWFPAFFAELRRLGYVEGQNLRVERYSAEGQTTQYADLAREVVSRRPDVILSGKNDMVLLLKDATMTIPIVGITADPIAAGIVPWRGRVATSRESVSTLV
jgi:putative tryptophan/tyrosine transport system substrate-binding protein